MMTMRALGGLVPLVLLCGCSAFGSQRLQSDPVDYAHALNVAQKRQTLLNIVGLRYADTPAFLQVVQVIAGYSLSGTASSSVNWSTTSSENTGQLGGNLTFSNHPTFTFSPVTGEAYAQAYIRPMSPALVLPLAQSGVPIDLLLRIAVQSIARHRNSAALSGPMNAGSPEFFELMRVLRALQLEGVLRLRYLSEGSDGRVFLSLKADGSSPPRLLRDVRRARELLLMGEEMEEVELVYGSVRDERRKIGVTTRSVVGILTELGAQIEVPESEVGQRAVLPTVGVIGGETRPAIVVHVGERPPSEPFTQVRYGNQSYWIAHEDFDSKFAFSVVQNLIALAQTSQTAAPPAVTIPAN